MAARLLLTDEEWGLIADLFPKAAATGRPRRDPRQVLNGIFWILRTGAAWRDLPVEFGAWQSAWRLFDEWNSLGVFDQILRRLRGRFVELDLIDEELWCIDGTIARAHRCAGGGGKKAIQASRMITP